MIRQLRARHRLIWLLIAVLLPVAFFVALVSRPESVLPEVATPGGEGRTELHVESSP